LVVKLIKYVTVTNELNSLNEGVGVLRLIN
jgi:hypothetical protein